MPAGSLLANAVFNLFSLLPNEAFLSWGWRIPFLFGIGLLAVGLFIRLPIYESPLFAQIRDRKQQAAVPLFEVLKRYPRNVLLAMGARMAENGGFYVFSVFVLDLCHGHTGSAANGDARTACSSPRCCSSWRFPSSARSPTASAAAPSTWAVPPRWPRSPSRSSGWSTRPIPSWICLAISIALIAQAAMYAPQAAFFSELFGTDVRYTGASIGYQLASPLAGGLAPLICVAARWADGNWGIAVYLIVLSAITIISVWLAEETHHRHLENPEERP